MTEALTLAIDHLFTSMRNPAEAVEAHIIPQNVASERLLKKLGFRYDHSLENGMQAYRLGKEAWTEKSKEIRRKWNA